MSSTPEQAATPASGGENGVGLYAEVPGFDVVDGELLPRAPSRVSAPAEGVADS